MEIKGRIHEIGAEHKVTDTFKKRDLIIEYAENPSYPEYIKFEATQDKTALFESFKVGDHVEVFFNLRGRAWTNPKGETVYFNTLNVWRLNAHSPAAGENIAPSTPNTAAPVMPEPDLAPKLDTSAAANDADDLPF